jgi:cytochrome c553
MKRIGIKFGIGATVAIAAVTITALGMAQELMTPAAGPLQEPRWAYAIPGPDAINPAFEKHPADYRYSIPGSVRTFPLSEIGGATTETDIADWFPDDHPPMPPVVARGAPARGVTECGLCHYPNGKGRPENAPLAGLSKLYIMQTLRDMKAGLRKSAEPRKFNAGLMDNIARKMTDEEVEAAATYFSSVKYSPWIRVVESDPVPKARASGHGIYYLLTGADAGAEPIAGRIIEAPENIERSELTRDPHSGFVAYVPPGSVAKGKRLAEDKHCDLCHGDGLTGLDPAPALAGRSPSYVARQLNDFRQGTRKGAFSGQMARVTSRLSSDEITSLAAYTASLPVQQ